MNDKAVKSVPFITLNRFEPGFKDEFLNGVKHLVENTQFVGGPIVAELEGNLKTYTKVKYALGCANGTDALQIALRALGVSRGDKVLVPDMTFWATFEAVVNVGANPVTIDVDQNTAHWDLNTFKKAVDMFKPKAAIMVHLYGHASPDTESIRQFAKDHNVLLLEDGAQCFGVKLNGKGIFEGALIATTSFYPAKVLGASGDAGAIFTNDESLMKNCHTLINHGRTDHYSHGMVGWNSRIGAYESLFLNLSLKHIDARIQSRMMAVETYTEVLRPYAEILKPVRAPKSIEENGYCSVFFMKPELRTRFIQTLKDRGIGFGTIYPGAMSKQSGALPYIKENGLLDFGHGHLISQSVINLPCFQYITKEELDYTLSVTKEFINGL